MVRVWEIIDLFMTFAICSSINGGQPPRVLQFIVELGKYGTRISSMVMANAEAKPAWLQMPDAMNALQYQFNFLIRIRVAVRNTGRPASVQTRLQGEPFGNHCKNPGQWDIGLQTGNRKQECSSRAGRS